jgi:hypothetical protein
MAATHAEVVKRHIAAQSLTVPRSTPMSFSRSVGR